MAKHKRFMRRKPKSTTAQCKKNTTALNKIKKGIEVKQLVTDFDVPLILDDGTNLKALTLIAQGTANGTRVGDKIEVQSILVRGHVVMDPNVLNTSNIVRLVVMAQHNNQLPAYSGLYNSVDVYSHRTLKFGKLSTILADKTFNVNLYGKNEIFFKFTIKRRLKLEYSGPLVTDIAYNQITAFFISNAGIRWPAGLVTFQVNYTDA